jgi:hypothetical protein
MKVVINRCFGGFGAKVAGILIAVAILLVVVPFALVSCAMKEKSDRYFKVQRLNFNGEVLQTYYSKNFPCDGNHYIYFREYPSGKCIQFSAPYTAEDIGTNKP